MAKTFLELQQSTAILAQHTSVDGNGNITYDSNFLVKAKTWINLSQEFLANIYDFWTELQGIHNFSTADGTEAYDMPEGFDKPFRVYDLTNKKKIIPQTEEVYIDANISAIADATEGKPSKHRIYGVSDRLKQMKLGLIPDDAYSIRVWYKKVPDNMVEDEDYPFIKAESYFIWDAVGFALKWEKEEQKAQLAWGKAKEALTVLLNNQMLNLGVDYIHKITNRWTQSHRM